LNPRTILHVFFRQLLAKGLGDLTIIVALPSGRTTEVSVSQSATVADLRATAVRALQLGARQDQMLAM